MKERERRLAHAVLIEVLHYDPVSGAFTWRKRTSNRVKVGDVAGQLHRDGHRMIGVCGVRYYAHRLAWFYVNGVWPENEIDHKDLGADHNWIDNLREATHADNVRNVARKRHNKTLFKGVHPERERGRFRAQISVNGKTKYLGLFKTPEEAHAAYTAASNIHHGEFGRSA